MSKIWGVKIRVEAPVNCTAGVTVRRSRERGFTVLIGATTEWQSCAAEGGLTDLPEVTLYHTLCQPIVLYALNSHSVPGELHLSTAGNKKQRKIEEKKDLLFKPKSTESWVANSITRKQNS